MIFMFYIGFESKQMLSQQKTYEILLRRNLPTVMHAAVLLHFRPYGFRF